LPSFDAHIKHVRHNLTTLQQFNAAMPECFDWQVTMCFYTAVHLVNAHLAKFGLHYQSHENVKNALSPFMPVSVSKIPEDEYAAYVGLQHLARRSRYLVNEKDQKNKDEEQAHLTYDKHLTKACRHLDTLLKFFAEKYNLAFDQAEVEGTGLNHNETLKFLVPKPKKAASIRPAPLPLMK
jgi:hypothetical protein